MSWRDVPFDNATNLAVAGPLNDATLGRLPESFRAWAHSEAAAPFRYARSGKDRRWMRVPASRVDAAVARSIVRVDGDARFAQLEAVARTHDYLDLGAILILSKRFAAVSFSHRLADGVSTLVALQTIFSGEVAKKARESRTPTLRALARTGQLGPGGLRTGRAFQRAMHAHLASAPLSRPGQQLDVATVTTSEFSVSSARLAELAAAARALEPGSLIPTTAVLSSLVFRAARRCLAADVDLPVRMLVGLRRYLGAGWSARGNFATGVIVGTLRGHEWSARDFRDIVTPLITSDAPIASYAVEGLARWRGALRARITRAAASTTPLMLSFNVLAGGIGLDSSDYEQGAAPRTALVMLNRGDVLGPHCTTSATGKDFVVTTVDDSGILDLSRFESAFRREERLLLAHSTRSRTKSSS